MTLPWEIDSLTEGKLQGPSERSPSGWRDGLEGWVSTERPLASLGQALDLIGKGEPGQGSQITQVTA